MPYNVPLTPFLVTILANPTFFVVSFFQRTNDFFAMKFLALLSTLALAAATPTPAGPNQSDVYVESIAYGGSGCPQGSVGQTISDDRTVFTLIFDSYIAAAGPGTSVLDHRKNCQITVNLHVPQGWSYTVGQFTYRGYAQLSAGQSATQTSIYYFSGESEQARGSTVYNGPVAKDYVLSDTIAATALVWSTCNAVAPLNISSQIAINGDFTKTAEMTTDSIDGKVTTALSLQWVKC